MMFVTSEFAVGSHYSNDQIRLSLHVENLGGIRPSLGKNNALRHLAVMTNTQQGKRNRAENPYHDRIEGSVLVYTASGRKGNQTLAGRNKRVLEQYASPIPIFGFANQGQQVYEFLGLLELLRHYEELQFDQLGTLRNVWVFEFYIHREPSIVPISKAAHITAEVLHPSKTSEQQIESEREIVPLERPNIPATSVTDIDIEELRSHLLQIDPFLFEHFVKVVLEKVGFSSVEVTRATGDGGIDLTAEVSSSSDFFAGMPVQFQVKRWRHSVGSVEINAFRGAISHAANGVFITTSHFTRAAVENASNPLKQYISLLAGKRLATIILRGGMNLGEFHQ